jgi:hypothetical protein
VSAQESTTRGHARWAKLLYHPPGNPQLGAVPEDYLPEESVVSSYARQWYRFTVGDKSFAVRPTVGAKSDPQGWPTPSKTGPCRDALAGATIIGYLHRRGVPSLLGDHSNLRELALSEIDAVGGTATDVVALQHQSQWVEPALAVTGVAREVLLLVAKKLGQQLVTVVGPERIKVVDVTGVTRKGGYTWDLLELGANPCPLSVGYTPRERPAREGGPWTSQSMAVAGQWSLHHRYSHSLLECDACATRKPEQGRPILLDEWVPASRYNFMYPMNKHHSDGAVLRRLEPELAPDFHDVGRAV